MRSDRWVAPFGMTVALVEPRLPDSRSKRVTLTFTTHGQIAPEDA